MQEEQFWRLIDTVRAAARTQDERPDVLTAKLSALDLGAIQAFQVRYEELLLRANRWDLWGAAYLMNGGCSDDGFKYFRDWLISEGRSAFEAALERPESLASLPKQEYFELELFGYAASRAFEAKGGGELDRSFEVELAQPQGTEWSEEELPKLFPKLAAKYGHH
jgi:hypothetical protein